VLLPKIQWSEVDPSGAEGAALTDGCWVSEHGELYIDPTGHGPGWMRDRVTLGPDEPISTWDQANGRAAARSRRYFVWNQLRYMWVLTFAESQQDRRWVMRQVSDLARRLRRSLGGSGFAYWYSPELHPGGHGWHVNLFLPIRVEHSDMDSLWGQGFVWVTDFASAPKGPYGEPLGMCPNSRDGWRRAARYGCKYAQKDWSPEHVGSQNHRYEIAQGFAPSKEACWVHSEHEAELLVKDLVDPGSRADLATWNSNDTPNWNRPPVRTWRW